MNAHFHGKLIATGLGAMSLLTGVASASFAQGVYTPNSRPGLHRGDYGGNDSRDYSRNDRDRAQTDWSGIDHKPNFNTDSRPGLYVWRDADDVYLVANGPGRDRDNNRDNNRNDTRRFRRNGSRDNNGYGSNRSVRYTGEITVQGGKISGIGGYQTDRGDRIEQVADNRVRYDFSTERGLDGVRIHVKGGQRIIISAQTEGRSQNTFYLGGNQTVVRADRLVVRK